LPSAVVTVIVAVPADRPATLPFISTEAIFESLLVQATVWIDALTGAIEAISVSASPTAMRVLFLLIKTPVTAIGLTVKTQTAVNPPSVVVAVIAALPGATAVTVPYWSTVATARSPLDHATDLFVAFAGITVAVKVSRSFGSRPVAVLLSVKPVAGIVTITEQTATRPSVVDAVIVAWPAAIAITAPFVTVATLVLLVLQVTVLFNALSG